MASDFATLKQRLTGVAAVPICPFNSADESIDEPGFRRQLEYLLASGVDTLVPSGNTTEYYAMSVAEADRVNEITLEVVAGRMPVIIGIGHDLGTAIRFAKRAEEGGAAAVMIHQPVQPFQSAKGVEHYIEAVATAVNIGVILYVRRELLTSSQYRHLFGFENVVGVKHATNDLQYFSKLVRETQDYDVSWVCGSAEGWAPFYHVAGAKGFTSGLANVFPKFTISMREALRSGDLAGAMTVWEKIEPFEAMRAKHDNAFNVAVVKEALRIIGRPAGTVRRPASELSDDDKQSLAAIIARWQREEAVRS